MVKFTASAPESKLIQHIVARYVAQVQRLAIRMTPTDRLVLEMDVEAVHSNGMPLKLEELAHANTSDLVHDIAGIHRHIDRNSGQLQDCFVPRYAANQ